MSLTTHLQSIALTGSEVWNLLTKARKDPDGRLCKLMRLPRYLPPAKRDELDINDLPIPQDAAPEHKVDSSDRLFTLLTGDAESKHQDGRTSPLTEAERRERHLAQQRACAARIRAERKAKKTSSKAR